MSSMRAVNYQGPFQVKVEDVERPKLEHPDDVIVKVTTVCHPVVMSGLALVDVSRLPYVVLICTCMRAAQLLKPASPLVMRTWVLSRNSERA